ncbi:MAG: DUF3352 domain-containing protein, partial [Nocardioides sp.]
MADNHGPNEQQAGSDAPGAPEYLESTTGASLPGEAGGRRRALIAGGVVGGLALTGAAAWAGVSFFANGAQPSEALPAKTLGYVSVDLSPSGEQQLEAYRFLRKFPGAKDDLDLDNEDPRAMLFELLQDDGVCEDLDFDKDIDPWLGNSAAVALVDLGEDEPAPVAVLELADPDSADKGLARLRDCEGEGGSGAWTIEGDWAVLAEKKGIAQDVVDATKKSSLDEDEDHGRWMDELGDLGVMTTYISPAAADKAAEFVEDLTEEQESATDGLAGMQDPSQALSAYSSMLDDFNGMSATLRFEDAKLKLVAAAESTGAGELTTDRAGKAVAGLPADVVAGFGLSVDEGYVETLLESVEDSGVDQSEIESQVGIELPDDLRTLLGESLVFAVGDEIDFEEISNSQDGSGIPVGVRIQGDADGIESVLDKLRGKLSGEQDLVLLESEKDGKAVAIGPDDDFRRDLLAGGSLGDSETYREVVEDAEEAS